MQSKNIFYKFGEKTSIQCFQLKFISDHNELLQMEFKTLVLRIWCRLPYDISGKKKQKKNLIYFLLKSVYILMFKYSFLLF